MVCFRSALFATMLFGCAGSQACQLPPGISLTLYNGPQNAPAVLGALGTTPAALLLDTGASTSTLSPGIAQQAGLAIEPIQGDLNLTGMTGDVIAGLTTLPQFTLGTATAARAQFVVATTFPENSPLDGILGDDFLREYDIDLNIPQHNATLYPAAASPCVSAMPPWPGAATAVPVHEDRYGRIYLTLLIAGVRVEGLLDSGATISSMPESLFESSGLAAAGQKLAKDSVSGVSGASVQAQLYQLTFMQMGDMHIAAPLLVVYSPLDYTDAKKREHAHALASLGLSSAPLIDDNGIPYFVLGRDFISGHRLFISHSTDTLYIQ